MNIKDYLRTLSPDEREALADAAGTTVPYLYQLAGGHRDASAKLAVNIERATAGQVTRRELRPDLFGEILPEPPPPEPPDRRSGADRRQSANRRAEESPGRRQGDDRRAAERRRGEEETDAA